MKTKVASTSRSRFITLWRGSAYLHCREREQRIKVDGKWQNCDKM